MNKASLKILAAGAAALQLLASCGERAGGGGVGAGKPKVVATTSMIADMVEDLVGDKAEVIGLMGPGVNPHDYSPTAGDVSALQNASAVFYNGLFLEGRMAELFDKLSASGKPVYALGDIFSSDKLIYAAGAGQHADPHIWGDAGMWARCVEVVVEGLAGVFPEDAEAIRKRGSGLAESYRELDVWAKGRLAEIPEGRRYLITSHDAFGYFGRAYGLEVVGIEGISTVGEAGIGDIVKAVDFIKEKGVPAIFVETSTNRDAIERISTDSGAKIGGELFSDAMGNPGDVFEVGGRAMTRGTYVGMIKFNVETVVGALGGG